MRNRTEHWNATFTSTQICICFGLSLTTSEIVIISNLHLLVDYLVAFDWGTLSSQTAQIVTVKLTYSLRAKVPRKTTIERQLTLTASSECAHSLAATSLRMPYLANFHSYRSGVPQIYP